MKPIVLIHGYSSEGRTNRVEDIYGSLPADLRREFGAGNVLDINLSRWISLSDGIALDDVSFAMERALRSRAFGHLLKSGFHVVVHSTGALVVRNWLRLYSPQPSPIANLVHLAGANFGSGLAHIGRGTLARWYRQIFQGVDAGVRVLNELEFGSTKTLDLHLHFLQPGRRLREDFGVREYGLIGSQTLKPLRVIPVRYVKEDSADSTVRTSACNPNFNHVRVAPSDDACVLDVSALHKEIECRLDDEKVDHVWYAKELASLADDRPPIPFAVLYETAHLGDDLGILDGTKTRRRVLPLLKQALTVDDDAAYRAAAADFDRVTARTLARAGRLKGTLTSWDPHKQYEGHSQLVFRLNDQFGEPVASHDITFNSGGRRGQARLETMIEDKHVNRAHRGTVTYYLRTQRYVQKGKGREITSRLDDVAPVDFEVTGHEPQSGEIAYLPLRLKLTAAEVRKVIQPFRTTVVDVTLLRLPTGKVFRLKKVT
jgi:hypothetical protein